MVDNKKKKKLVIATDNFWPRIDGVSSLLNLLLPVISKHFDVTVIAPDFAADNMYKDHGPFPGDANFKLVKIPLTHIKVSDFRLAKFEYKTIRDAVKGADFIWIHTMEVIAYCAFKAARKFKIPIVYYMHSFEWDLVIAAMRIGFLLSLVRSVLKASVLHYYRKFNAVIFPSENISEYYGFFGIKAKRLVVNLGIDVKKFNPTNIKIGLRESIGISADDIVIGYHGRLSREKDLKTLARAFLLLQKKFKNVKLLIIGDGINEIKRIFSGKKNIIVTGFKTNVVPYLNLVDIYVMPSLTETTCLAVMEAMSCGKVVVSTRVGFINDYIRNGYNGYFFDKGDSYELYRKVRHLVNNKDKLHTMGLLARSTIVKNFNWEKQKEKFVDALNSVLKK